jgi:two-component system, NtrC family, sensor kinase
VKNTEITILIIDDNQSMIDTMEASLGSEGYKVIAALTGKEGIEKIKKARPSIVLLDKKLPDLDGLAVLEEIRGNQKFARLPIILVTGDTTVDIEEGFSYGADDCIIKPLNMKYLQKRIQELIRRKGKILVADDDRQICEILNKVITKMGYEVDTVHDGQSVIDYVKEKKPDLILLDIGFGAQPDGKEVCKKIKSTPKLKDVPVIMLTANEFVEDVEKSFQYGANDYIFKPFYVPDLILKVKKYLEFE